MQEPLPIWVAVDGTLQSVMRAATLGLPMALAIIGGMPEQFAPMVDLYREAWPLRCQASDKLRLSINSHGYIADESKQTIDEAFPPFEMMMNKIGRRTINER